MNSVHSQFRCDDRGAQRSGAIAIRETLLIVVAPIASLLLLYQALSICHDNPQSSVKLLVRPVYHISIDHDERQLWVYRLREDVVRMNLASGEVTQSLSMPRLQLSAVAHSREGSTSLLCAANGTVVLFREGQPSQTADLSPDTGVDASLSDNGTVAIAAAPGGRIHGWRYDGTTLREFSLELPSEAAILRVGLNPSGQRMFVARTNGFVSFPSLESQDCDVAALVVGTDCVEFAWSRDEKRFGVVTSDFHVRIYDVATGAIVDQGRLDDTRDYLEGVCASMSPDGRRLAVSTTVSPDVYLWDIEGHRPARRLKGHTGIVPAIQFSADSARLYTGSFDGTIREWSVESCSQLRTID